jgi:cobalt/nickel transport protein
MDRRYWLALLGLALLSPLGLLAQGGAWGEWGAEELEKLLGFVPAGIERAAGWWQGLLPDYSVKFLGEGRLAERAGYLICALLGSALVYGATVAYLRFVTRNGAKP